MTMLRRRAFTAVALAVAVTAIGALIATAHNGGAAAQVAPSNTEPPTISGTPSVGETLTADKGTWSGTAPIHYDYQWRRCDDKGGSCSSISGANKEKYALVSPDAGNTLRVRVTATNKDGSAAATSVPTAVVKAAPAPPATGCPNDKSTKPIPISNVASPAHLLLDKQSISPTVIGRSTQDLTVRFHVSACGGRSIQGALVYVTAVPYNQFSIPPEQPTDADGWASQNMHMLSGYPAARQQQLLVMFARARKQGEDILAGISARRLVSFPVDLNK